MPVIPINHGSMTYSSRITSYDMMAARIRRQLGEPMINIEIDQEQIYECIDIACEFFTKFSGYTDEYLIFRSDLYTKGYGLEIDKLINISPELYNTGSLGVSAGWDFDMNAYRKVVDVYSFEQGSNTGVNTLFTIEHTIAQQAYFGHLLGNVGYDLVTFTALKMWLDTREKVLGLVPHIRFNPETQIMRLIPEPSGTSVYYGLIGCRVQKPIKDIVSQLWVWRYALALVKINIGHIRGKYGGTVLFGGQTVNYQDLLNQGIAERDKLEIEMTQSGMDLEPPRFFIG